MVTSTRTTLASLDDVVAAGGVVAVSQGGTGFSSYTDGQILIGVTSTGRLAKAAIAGTTNQVVVTPGAGTITLSLPQSIHTGASPTFAGLTISGGGSVAATTSVLFIDEIRIGGVTTARLGRNSSNGAPFLGYNLKYSSPNYQHDSTGTTAGFVTNASGIQFYLDASQAAGTNISPSHQFTTAGSVVFGSGALATTATDGFVYMMSCAGPPTGVPTAFTGRVPWVYDSTNNKIYVYSGSAWRSTAALT